MASYNKFNNYVDNLAKAKIDWSSHTFKVLLTNSAPSASNAVKADITEISAGNGYSAGGPSLSGVTLSNSSGTEKVVITDLVITASGGSIGPFRYVVIYDDTQTSPADPLVAWYDYGSSVTLADADTFTIDFDGTNGLWQLV